MSDEKPWQFPKGKSGNPGGRKRGIERIVRDLIGDDLPKLVKAQIQIAQGLPPEFAPNLEIKAADTTRAFESLIDRGFGKVKQAIELSGEVSSGDPAPVDWSAVPLEERRQILDLALRLGALTGDDATEH